MIETKNERVKIETLHQASKNVRTHPKAQIEELKRSYESFGQYRPLVVTSDNEILVGNGLYTAMLELGVETVEVKRLPSDTPDAVKQKLMLADNRIYMLGADNVKNIDEIMGGLDDFDIPGFDPETLEELYGDFDEGVGSYGVLTDEQRGKIVTREGERTDLTHRERDEIREANGEVTFQNDAAESEDRHLGTYVTCPNCGMKIWE